MFISYIFCENEITFNEAKADRIIAEKTRYSATQRKYTTSLPWTDRGPPKCSNRRAAYAAAMRNLQKLYKNPEKWRLFKAAFEKLKNRDKLL